MALTRKQLLARLAQELRPDRRIHLCAGLPLELKPLLARGVRATSSGDPAPTDDVDVAVIEAVRVSERGLVDIAEDAKQREQEAIAMRARRVLVLMRHLDERGRPAVVAQSSGPLRADWVFTELCALEVLAEGLCIRELAPGVSARSVQDKSEPTLKLGPDVAEISVAVGNGAAKEGR